MLLLLLGQLMNGHTLPPTKQIVTVLVCFIIAISIHEFMHAFVALFNGGKINVNCECCARGGQCIHDIVITKQR